MRTIKLVIIVALISIPLAGFTQDNISYVYDQAGNRTEKVLTINGQKKSQESENDEIKQEEHKEIIKDATIKLYPNPTSGEITVDFENVEDLASMFIKVYDLNGSLIHDKKVMSKSMIIDLTNQPPGAYYLILSYKGEVSRWKIVKL